MSVKITFVIGGARSGKSSFVLNEVLEMKGSKAYIATAEALDDEMKDRIQQHKGDRGQEWGNYEEPVNIAELISKIKDKYEIVVLDCLTLWLSNVMIRTKNSDARSQNTDYRTQTTEKHINKLIETCNKLKNSVCSLKSGFCNLYIVSNEVGMGIVPENPLAREFRDLTGFLNQKVAEVADEVYMVTAGIPMKIK
jgi:adenosylcobinamide kinase/adenosylcobinamide-phosphate guanylyltransferase